MPPLAADARRLAALALDVSDDEQALLLAVEAARLDDSLDTRASLLAALSRNPALIASTNREQPLPSSRGRRLPPSLWWGSTSVPTAPGSWSEASGTTLYDAASLDRIATSDLSTSELAFRPDGRQLAASVSDHHPAGTCGCSTRTRLEETAVRLGELPDGRSAQVFDLDYSADGRFLAASVACCAAVVGTDSTLVWDLAAPERPFASRRRTSTSAFEP